MRTKGTVKKFFPSKSALFSEAQPVQESINKLHLGWGYAAFMGKTGQKQQEPAHEVSMEVTMPYHVREKIKALAALEGKGAQKYAEKILVNHVKDNSHRLEAAFGVIEQEGYTRPYRTPMQKILEKNKQLETENSRLKSQHR